MSAVHQTESKRSFGIGRHDQYEKFYAGAPFIVKQRFLWNFDFETPDRLINKALSGYDMTGRH